jgi:putative transposase
MARPPRLVIPGIALHIRHRGVNKAACFFDDTDRLVYLSRLRELAAATRCALHAYCLMTNHVHLLLTPPEEGAAAILMRELGQCYVQYVNRRHRRTGTLWEGRFRSCLVDSAAYVLACHRYIELNPVEAGMVPSPLAYRWSSHSENTGAEDRRMLSAHAEYEALAPSIERRQGAYRSLFGLPQDPRFLEAIRAATSGGYPLVGDALKARLIAEGRVHIERGKPGPQTEPETNDGPLNGELAFDQK